MPKALVSWLILTSTTVASGTKTTRSLMLIAPKFLVGNWPLRVLLLLVESLFVYVCPSPHQIDLGSWTCWLDEAETWLPD